MAQPGPHKLPAGFVAVRDILDGKHAAGSMVSVIGVVTDFRMPIPTRGPDYKCQIRLYDESVEDDGDDTLLINIFRSEEDMPVATCGDVIAITAAKVQQYQSDRCSLFTHWSTDIRIYLAANIPLPPQGALPALRPSNKKTACEPRKAESDFVSILYHSINKGRIPTEIEFVTRAEQSTNVKDKYHELKDVRDSTFVDVVVQFIRDPYDLGDKFTLWVSDYTENELFWHFAFSGGNAAKGQIGDPHGYLTGFTNHRPSEWTGPFGKRSLQVTCYEPHASVVRGRKLSNGSWVSLRNLQIKFGRQSNTLEGYLREDRHAQGVKINIVPLNVRAEGQEISPQLKNALRRRRDYESAKQKQLKTLSEQPTKNKPRKEPNSKERRKAKRALASKVAEQREAAPVQPPDINPQVKCENNNKSASLVADILEPTYHQMNIDDETVKLQLPFINANYRTNVRVVDYMPADLRDFSCSRKVSDYDLLSDNDESVSESEQDMMTDFTAERIWEWRFFLELEDAVAVGQQKRRFWVLVDNTAAQCLVSLDATDLRHDPETLEALRQRLFLLWGELEEHKSRTEKKRGAKGLDHPPADSSDDEGSEKKTPRIASRPFSCCIHQYGVKVPEPDACKADAGDGRRWQRMFGLFGTRIATM